MKDNSKSFFEDNSKKAKNEHFQSIMTIGISLLVCTLILFLTQKIMSGDTVSIANNIAEQNYYDGKYDEAISEYQLMQQEDEWPIWTVKMAEAYALKGDLTEANNLLKEAMVMRDQLMNEDKDKYGERDKEFINRVIFNFYINGDLEQAESLGEYYLQSYNSYKPLLKSMFAIYLATNNTTAAQDIVNIYDVDTESAYDLAILAKMQLLLENYEDGINTLVKAWKINKNEIKISDVILETAQYNKVKLEEEIKNLSEVNNEEVYALWLEEINSIDDKSNIIDNITKEINLSINKSELSKDSYLTYYIDSVDSLKKGNYEKAIDKCINSMVMNQEYVNTYAVLMPEILLAQGETSSMESYFRTAIYHEPFNYNLMSNIARIYEKNILNYDKAAEYYTLAAALNENEDILYYNLGNTNLSRGKFEEAIENVEKSISINSEKSMYYRALGTIYFENLEYEKAIENIRKAYSLDNDNAATLNNAACYYYMVEENIWRAYENMEAAYNNITDELDNNTKEQITNNYNEMKRVYDKFVNDENSIVENLDLKLIY